MVYLWPNTRGFDVIPFQDVSSQLMMGDDDTVSIKAETLANQSARCSSVIAGPRLQ
jgi:hypothetical protein